ncbi:hypothetical protein Lfu02_63950 [Longispora fulva]|nr:hypothetical protein Lfu02_63950 [Longispora fulva]
MSVDGYAKVYEGTQKGERSAVFLGPPAGDPKALVHGPGLTLKAGSQVSVSHFMEGLADGRVVGKDGKSCGVCLYGVKQGMTPIGTWNLTDKQSVDVRTGRLAALEVTVVCEGRT